MKTATTNPKGSPLSTVESRYQCVRVPPIRLFLGFGERGVRGRGLAGPLLQQEGRDDEPPGRLPALGEDEAGPRSPKLVNDFGNRFAQIVRHPPTPQNS